ncbi:MAG TPA: hypothetical protein VF576_09830, partial [Rubricoccaceae bacterium]
MVRALLLALVVLAAGPARAQYFAFGQNRVRYERPDWRVVQTDHVDVYYYEREGTDGRRAGGGRVLASFA